MTSINKLRELDDISLMRLDYQASLADNLQERLNVLGKMVAQACRSPGERVCVGEFRGQRFYLVADERPEGGAADAADS